MLGGVSGQTSERPLNGLVLPAVVRTGRDAPTAKAGAAS